MTKQSSLTPANSNRTRHISAIYPWEGCDVKVIHANTSAFFPDLIFQHAWATLTAFDTFLMHSKGGTLKRSMTVFIIQSNQYRLSTVSSIFHRLLKPITNPPIIFLSQNVRMQIFERWELQEVFWENKGLHFPSVNLFLSETSLNMPFLGCPDSLFLFFLSVL